MNPVVEAIPLAQLVIWLLVATPMLGSVGPIRRVSCEGHNMGVVTWVLSVMFWDVCYFVFVVSCPGAVVEGAAGHDVKNITCFYCGLNFCVISGTEVLRRHIHSHVMPEWEGNCPVCKGSFGFLPFLVSHFLEYHQGLANIRCDRCRQIFLLGDSFSSHNCRFI
jgi:hypothetical protein